MNKHTPNIESSGSPEQIEHAPRDHLPTYAALVALGRDPRAVCPRVAAHLADCEACRGDLEELLELTIMAYTGQIETAGCYPPVNLSFLHTPAPVESAQDKPWYLDPLGRLEIVFSEALLQQRRQPTLAGAARGQLLYRYVQEPGSLYDLDVTVEAFAEDLAKGLGRVRVGVDVPSRGPLDQAGNRVILRAGKQIWQDETDDSGTVDFTSIPLGVLPQLRVEVIPRRNAGA